MSNSFATHITDQQKLEAIDDLFWVFGEKETTTNFKHFLFKLQGAFLIESNQMAYSPTDACNHIDALYNFFEALEQKEKGGENE